MGRDSEYKRVIEVEVRARRKMERKEETNNFVLALVGATSNCGLPTLINFGRFILMLDTVERREENRHEISSVTTRRCAPYPLLDGIS